MEPLRSKQGSVQDYGSTSTARPQVEPTEEHPSNDPNGRFRAGQLKRGLSARQVQMIAVAGTIGTGLFLGTGRSLAQGGPASILICYGLVGVIVYITLLLLGEMATQYPVAGFFRNKIWTHQSGFSVPCSFATYTTRFFSPSYAFSLSWNYWFNDAVSVAGDLTAAQLVLKFWFVNDNNGFTNDVVAGVINRWIGDNLWIISLVFLLFLIGVNACNVNAYGEMEYLLSSLKVATIVIFIVIGILVNAGFNRESQSIGFSNWNINGAPFVGGLSGFAKVFVTASFAYGGTESLGITAGETRNPSRNMPRVVKFVFWRILLFYILSIIIIGLNVPWDYPNLSNRNTTTSPFTIVFAEAGSNVAASFMNAVILSSVLSAGNHALFAGTRVLYSLATSKPRLAPAIFSATNRAGVPYLALLATSSISALCFGSAFIGSGVLWGWLQNIVGVSNQIAWLSIGISSWRFRQAWVAQGRPLEDLKFRAAWTWPWGPPFVVVAVSILIIFQGWSSFIPHFTPIEFVSYYIEIPVMTVMFFAWFFVHHDWKQALPGRTLAPSLPSSTSEGDDTQAHAKAVHTQWFDVVDIQTIDLHKEEHQETEEDVADDQQREDRLQGRFGFLWKAWYLLA